MTLDFSSDTGRANSDKLLNFSESRSVIGGVEITPPGEAARLCGERLRVARLTAHGRRTA